jgi:hypothetical protein
VVYKNLVFVEVPGLGVVCDLEEEVIFVPRLLPFMTIDECMLGVDGFVYADTALEVPSEEEIATDSDWAMIVVTDVLI